MKEGLPPDRIIKTGSPMYEVLTSYKHQIESSDILKKLELQKNKYFVVSVHREENITSELNFSKILRTLDAIANKYCLPIIVSTHPRTKKRLANHSSDTKISELIRWNKPMSFSDYNALQINAKMVLSDSGTISEESSILKFRALNLREAHERPEAMEEAAVMMIGLDPERVIEGIEQLLFENHKAEVVSDYTSDYVSSKIVKIILSYVDYVNRNVWRAN